MEEMEYRKCLYCRLEIDPGRLNNANFCNGKCRAGFRRGMAPEKFREACDKNRLVPIRGTDFRPPKERRAQRRTDNLILRICGLSEYDRCSEKFMTDADTGRKYCCYGHQVKYNSIKAQERRVAKRNDN